jgi:hypothetical protein
MQYFFTLQDSFLNPGPGKPDKNLFFYFFVFILAVWS